MTGSDTTDGTAGAAANGSGNSRAADDVSAAGFCDADTSDPWQLQLSALGAFIRAQRRLADLSLREMAAITKISNAYLSQVERGLHQPSLKVLQAIGEALGISNRDLLSHAGFSEAPDADGAVRRSDTEQAILADPRLSEEQKAALVAVYRGFTGGTPPRGHAGQR